MRAWITLFALIFMVASVPTFFLWAPTAGYVMVVVASVVLIEVDRRERRDTKMFAAVIIKDRHDAHQRLLDMGDSVWVMSTIHDIAIRDGLSPALAEAAKVLRDKAIERQSVEKRDDLSVS